MLFDGSGNLGLNEEGSVNHPIILQGCTAEAFANFLGWLNHKYVCTPSFYYIILTQFMFRQIVHGQSTKQSTANNSLTSSMYLTCGRQWQALTLPVKNCLPLTFTQLTVFTLPGDMVSKELTGLILPFVSFFPLPLCAITKTAQTTWTSNST